MTRFGAGALTLGGLLSTLGFACAWPEVTLLGVALVSAVLLSLGYALRGPNLHIDRTIQPPRVEKGEHAIAYLEFANLGHRTLGRTVARQPFGASSVQIVLPRLQRGQRGMRTYRLPTSERGVFALPPLEISRGDPFGFVQLTQRHAGTDEIWVYPKILRLHALPSGPRRHLEGPSSDTSPQGNITFHRLREYVEGDDLRVIHWKSSARTGTLMVRHNVDTSQPYTVVVLDVHPDSYSPESFELAVDAAASVVTCASHGKAPVQLRKSDDGTIGSHRSHDPQGILDHLTRVETSAAHPLTNQLEWLRRERGGTALVVVTGVLGSSVVPAAAALRHRFERVVVITVTDAPASAPQHPAVTVLAVHDHDSLERAWNYGVTP